MTAREQRRRYEVKWERNNWEKKKLSSYRARAKRIGVDFDLDEQYLKDIYPEDGVCPVLGIPMIKNGTKQHPQTASLDRMSNEKGYVKGNVCYISWRANDLKKNAIVEELEAIVIYLKGEEK